VTSTEAAGLVVIASLLPFVAAFYGAREAWIGRLPRGLLAIIVGITFFNGTAHFLAVLLNLLVLK
jgi:hypothetical protein